MYGTDEISPDAAHRILVTGATGTVGKHLLTALARAGQPVVAAARGGERHREPRGGGPNAHRADTGARVAWVRFDYDDPSSWPQALQAVDRVFLVRPPAVADVRAGMLPFLEAARSSGVRHVVLLSVQGADRIPVVPHARLERWLRGSGLGWTFVRPSFFIQNLTGVHAPDIAAGRLPLPAGKGRTAFVDARDVALVAAAVLSDLEAHDGRVWTPTGPQALTYEEVASHLCEALGRPIEYEPVGLLRFARHAHGVLGMDWPMVAVTSAIYTTARLGLAAALTDDVRTVTGTPPASLVDVVLRDHAVRVPASPGADRHPRRAVGPPGRGCRA